MWNVYVIHYYGNQTDTETEAQVITTSLKVFRDFLAILRKSAKNRGNSLAEKEIETELTRLF